MVARICSRLREDKNFNTEVSCDDKHDTNCCFDNRIFTKSNYVSDLSCLESWKRCTTGTTAGLHSGMSDLELIWVIVACCLIFIVLLIIVYFIYRLMELKKDGKVVKTRHNSDVMVITVVENMGDRVKTMEARPNVKTMEAGPSMNVPTILLTSNRGNSPKAIKAKLKELIEQKDEEKLEALLDTIENFYKSQLSDSDISEAKGVLEIWKLEQALVERVGSEDGGDKTAQELQEILKKIELSEYKSHIAENSIIEARSLITSVTSRQELVRDLKQSLHSAIQEDNTEMLESLVDTIRAKQLDIECENELILAQNKFEKICANDKRMVESELTKAIEMRQSAGLRRAVQRVEKSNYSADLAKELENAKRIIIELEEIEKSRNLHRLKISSAVKSGDTIRMEKCIQETKFSGFGEDLRKELDTLELNLKRKYLQKRLRGNLNVAVTSLDLIKLRRAVNEATAAGFLKELDIELHQAHGLITKLERLELIKRAVLELNNTQVAEIKSYTAPPVEVHRVLMSLLIVLGENAEVVRDWFEIQVILIKTGKLSLKRRVQDFMPQDLSMAMAKRAAKLLNGISHQDLHSISQAAKVFYLWTSAVVEDKLSNDTVL